MKIVHIGVVKTPMDEMLHVAMLRGRGHDVYIPGSGTHAQLVRRIIDADEIHIWDITREFELGIVYFYSVHALHFKLGWSVKLFGDGRRDGKLSALFRAIAGVCPSCGGRGKLRHWYAQDELGWKDCENCADSRVCDNPIGVPICKKTGLEWELDPEHGLPCEKGTGSCDAEKATLCASHGGCAKNLYKPPAIEFVPPCGSGIGPCNECADAEVCRQLRAEHNA